jgi:hypothetical protein
MCVFVSMSASGWDTGHRILASSTSKVPLKAVHTVPAGITGDFCGLHGRKPLSVFHDNDIIESLINAKLIRGPVPDNNESATN